MRKCYQGTSLAVQWLRFRASTAGGGAGSIPGLGTKILPAVRQIYQSMNPENAAKLNGGCDEPMARQLEVGSRGRVKRSELVSFTNLPN